MNDPLVAAAVRGTQRAHPPPSTIPEIDALLARLDVEGDERRMLLAAGMLRIYGRAGCVPWESAMLPAAAPAEVLRPCSHQVSEIVRELLESRRHDLLREALARMARAQLRLPHELLPRLLDVQHYLVRQALAPVLGERGRWLARFNAEWRWLADFDRAQPNALPPDAETTWQEGTLFERSWIVVLHRRIAPTEALERLRGAFTQEGARARASFLSALRTGLSEDDEPFLEAALDDRSEAVRREAAAMLIDLPGSAYVARMRRRADDMLRMHTGQGLRLSKRKLEVVRPDAVDEGWKRDALEKKQSTDWRDVWQWQMRQIIGAVPVRHWLERFDLSIDALLAAVEKQSRAELLAAWTSAALRYGEQDLMPALWDAAVDLVQDARTDAGILDSLLGALAREMRPDDLDGRIASRLKHPDRVQETWYTEVLETLPTPWSTRVGEMYLRFVGTGCTALQRGDKVPNSWSMVLHRGRDGLPDRLLDQGLALLSRFDETTGFFSDRTALKELRNDWYMREGIESLKELRHDWRMRQRILEALPE